MARVGAKGQPAEPVPEMPRMGLIALEVLCLL
jgi:hypothetical protein